MIKKVGDLQVGDEIDLVMTVPAKVIGSYTRQGQVWIKYERTTEAFDTFFVPYDSASADAQNAQDR